ncbi:MAG: A/G-specific adenine glycosylase [Alphaproteobacteria bacterium]
MQNNLPRLSRILLEWYDRNQRRFPWRSLPGEIPDPYQVWLSEIMLQQTGTATVIPYFNKFMTRWPTVQALADAQLDDVLTQWAGLGYYARARNLHRCAGIISTDMNGVFPRDCAALQQLPGIGPYTAAAIAAIAHDAPGPVLDGNIERVLSRLHAVQTPLPASRPELRNHSLIMIDCDRPGDVAQAMMDLGAGVCTPRNPDCGHCPWREFCQAYLQNIAETLPVRQKKPATPTRIGAIFWLTRKDGAVLLRRRPEKGLLGGMMEFPGTPWREENYELTPHAPAVCAWQALPGTVRHVFTHFKLELTVYTGTCARPLSADGIWAPRDKFQDYALPTVMQKVAAHVDQHMNDDVS